MPTLAKLGDTVIYTQYPGTGEVFSPTQFPAVVVGLKGVDENGDSLVDLHILLPQLSTPTETDYDEGEIAIRNAARADVKHGASSPTVSSWHEKE